MSYTRYFTIVVYNPFHGIASVLSMENFLINMKEYKWTGLTSITSCLLNLR